MSKDYEEERQEFHERFEILCKKCGSPDVVVDFEQGRYYSPETGWDNATVSFGCNACKQNDMNVSL